MLDSMERLFSLADFAIVAFIAYKFVKAWNKNQIVDMLFYGIILILKKH